MPFVVNKKALSKAGATLRTLRLGSPSLLDTSSPADDELAEATIKAYLAALGCDQEIEVSCVPELLERKQDAEYEARATIQLSAFGKTPEQAVELFENMIRQARGLQDGCSLSTINT